MKLLKNAMEHIKCDKRSGIKKIIGIIYLMGLVIITSLAIHGYVAAGSGEKYMLLAFQNVSYLALYSILCLSLYLLTTAMKIERKFAVIAFLFGLCYVFVMTPLSIPDEQFHYNTSYALSNQLMLNESEYSLISQYDSSTYPFVKHINTPEGYIALAHHISEGNLFSKGDELTEYGLHRHSDSLLWTQYPMQYLPQALGITLARLINGNFLLVFLSARMFNLIFYVICGYLSIKILSKINTRFTYTMFLIGIMPMVLHQAASLSYDSYGIGLAFLLTSSMLSAIFRCDNISKKEYAFILIVSVLFAPFKLTYFPLCLLCILIPQGRFRSKKHSLVSKAVLIVFSAVFLMIYQASTVTNVSDMVAWDVYTIDYVMRHPLNVAALMFKTVLLQISNYFLGSIGTNLSGQTLILPGIISLTWLITILISTTYRSDDSMIFSRSQRAFSFFAVLLAGVLVLVGLLLHWTPVGSDLIVGIQPRYFILLFPLFFMTAKSRIFVCEEQIGEKLIGTAVFLQCMAIAYIVFSTIEKYVGV